MADKNEKTEQKDKTEVCPYCGGTGKIRLKAEVDRMLGLNTNELVCPACGGRGRVSRLAKYSARPIRLRLKNPLPKMLSRKPLGHRSGRLSRSPVILPRPGTSLSDWPEGDMVPKPSPETAYSDANIKNYVDYYEKPDDDTSKKKYKPTQNDAESILRLSDDIHVTLGKEFGPNVVLDPDFIEINFKQVLEANSGYVAAEIRYGFKSDEHIETLMRQIDPLDKSTILELDGEVYYIFENIDRFLDIETRLEQVPIEAHISQRDAECGLKVTNETLAPLTLHPHQPTSALSHIM